MFTYSTPGIHDTAFCSFLFNNYVSVLKHSLNAHIKVQQINLKFSFKVW